MYKTFFSHHSNIITVMGILGGNANEIHEQKAFILPFAKVIGWLFGCCLLYFYVSLTLFEFMFMTVKYFNSPSSIYFVSYFELYF